MSEIEVRRRCQDGGGGFSAAVWLNAGLRLVGALYGSLRPFAHIRHHVQNQAYTHILLLELDKIDACRIVRLNHSQRMQGAALVARSVLDARRRVGVMGVIGSDVSLLAATGALVPHPPSSRRLGKAAAACRVTGAAQALLGQPLLGQRRCRKNPRMRVPDTCSRTRILSRTSSILTSVMASYLSNIASSLAATQK